MKKSAVSSWLGALATVSFLLAITAIVHIMQRTVEREAQRDHLLETSVVHIMNERTDGKKTAVVMTPYDLTPGGGEKYLLDFCYLMQLRNFHVIILAYADTHCTSMQCIGGLADRVRVPVDNSELEVRIASREGMADAVAWFRGRSDLYFQLGNSKAPMFPNPAKVCVPWLSS